VRPDGLGKFEKTHLIETRSSGLPACSIVPQLLHYGVPRANPVPIETIVILLARNVVVPVHN
jgi:hypothetical protein